MNQKKVELLEHLAKYGKNDSWENLAIKFGFKSAEAARCAAKNKAKRLAMPSSSATFTTTFTENNRELWIKNVLYPYPPEPEEVIRDHKIDTKKYKLNQYWSKAKPELGGYFVSASFLNLNIQDDFTQIFLNFLKEYEPKDVNWDVCPDYKDLSYSKGTIIINKQDSHINKLCIYGSNDVDERLRNIQRKTVDALARASVNCKLDKVIYILGSDVFNSEWTKTTTRGTGQEDIGSYMSVFEKICNFELQMIKACKVFANTVEVIYVPGNHDKFVGWHLATWLEAIFRENESITFDTEMRYTKYRSIYDSAVAFNHGYEIKPEMLCSNFPVEFKEGFCNSNFYYVFTGDKHVEESKSFGAIKFYRLASMSRAVSDWDASKGYTSGLCEMTVFGFEEGKGVNLILKEPM